MRIRRLDLALGIFVALGLALVAAIYLVPDPPEMLDGAYTEQSVMDAHPEIVEARCPDRQVEFQDRFECEVTLSDGSMGTVEVTQVGEEGWLGIGEVQPAD
ncbi:MAG TPA: hypothetical protein VF295_12565 [Candidatus Limnocylindria bacterium]